MRKVFLGLLIFIVSIIILSLIKWIAPALNEEVPVPSILQDKETAIMMKLTSPAFKEGEFIPSKYTCDEAPPQGPYGFSPPLQIEGVPEGAKSLVLVMDDPDVPKERRPSGVFDHWVLYNIPPSVTFFDEGKFEGTAGVNGAGGAEYRGPCPPPEYQPSTHRYFFKLFATDLETLNFIKAPTKDDVLTAIEGHILAEAELMGRYDRTKTIRENN